MSTTTSACQNCAAPLPSASPGGLCPACLMGEAIDSLDTMQEGPSTDRSLRTSPLVPDPLEGTSLGIGGRYKILQRLGEGGFGTVYMAEQSVPVRRRVAIKVLKAGMDTRQVVARFEAERQALAMMDHPNIAHVFDGGETEQGRSYFVMELVRGTPITNYCDEEALTTRQRLDLFLKVCRAVQHAHQKGVIHRDLKPANVLVTVEDGAEAVPKIIDFGVAKATEAQLTDKTLFTRFEQMIGTPAYMSPEQAGARAAQDVDTRADIYALGVLLYELLTSTTPFEATTLQRAAFDEVRRILREEEAPRPSARLSSLEAERRTTIAKDRNTGAQGLGRQLRGDLDWIVMKAIEKDRRRRYETANALAMDVERHLEDQPVSAGPPTVGYRLSKWTKRNARWAAIGVGIFLIMAGATSFSVWQASLARDAEARASENYGNLQTAYHELDAANQTAQQARDETRQVLVRTLLEKGTSQFNEGDCTALLTLQQAVAAAAGDPALEEMALEFWTLARSWLPGGVHYVIDEPYAVALSHDESKIAWCDGRSLHLYRPVDDELRTISADPSVLKLRPHPMLDHFDILTLIFSPDDQLIALHNPEAGKAQVWDVPTTKPVTGILSHPTAAPKGDGRWLADHTMAAFNPEGDQLATMALGGTVCLWSVLQKDLVTPPWSIESARGAVGFSSDGQKLVIGTAWNTAQEDRGPSIYVIDLDGPSSPERILQEKEAVHELMQTREANWVTRDPGFGKITLWNPSLTRRTAQTSVGAMVEDMCLSSNGQRIAAGYRDGSARLYSSSTLKTEGAPLLHGGGGVRGVGFSMDGTVLATGGLDGSIQFWDLEEKRPRLGKWPQPGVVDQLVAPAGGSTLFVTKSRARDKSYPPRAFLRSFPRPISSPVGSLRDGDRIMDVSRDGNSIIIRSEDSLRLWVSDRLGTRVNEGPALDPLVREVISAKFFDGNRLVALSTRYGDAFRYGIWDAAKSTFQAIGSAIQKETEVAAVFPTSPPVFVTVGDSWSSGLIDGPAGATVLVYGFGNTCRSAVVADSAGWYAISDRSGNIRRFDLDSYSEIGPTIRENTTTYYTALSGDNKWLVNVERDQERDVVQISARYIVGDPPFFQLAVPIRYAVDKIFPVEERGFVTQYDHEIHRFDLPKVTVGPAQVKRLTEGTLGVRKDQAGELQFLTSKEFSAAQVRKKASGRDR